MANPRNFFRINSIVRSFEDDLKEDFISLTYTFERISSDPKAAEMTQLPSIEQLGNQNPFSNGF